MTQSKYERMLGAETLEERFGVWVGRWAAVVFVAWCFAWIVTAILCE
ncbi:MAG: hypothetical protein V4674_02000 [Patescibacteria group bacterium]